MQINSIKNYADNINVNSAYQSSKTFDIANDKVPSTAASLKSYSAENMRANFAPVSFKGNAPKIKNAFIITSNTEDIPLLKTQKNGSFLIDFDSQTEIVYGLDAIKYLEEHDEFTYDTQVIFPKKAEGTLHINGNDVSLSENSAVLLNAGTKAKIDVSKGYPMMIMSKKDYDWYERYGKDAQDTNIKNKFTELMYYNSHLFNGDFTPNILLSDALNDDKYLQTIGINKWESKNNLIVDIYAKKDLLDDDKKQEIEFIKGLIDKLQETGVIEQKDDGYLRFANKYKPEYMKGQLEEQGFSEAEIAHIMPIYTQSRQVHMDSKFGIKNSVENYTPELVQKMKDAGILHNNKKDADTNIYWKECYGNEKLLRARLSQAGFTPEEQDAVVDGWKNENYTGLDLSGLKFINEDVAVYNLDDKLNNWTLEKTNWISNSTAPQSSDGKTPFVGVSMVQTDEERPIAMSELRKEEKLHTHPNLAEKRQSEIYLVTSGAAALNIIKDGKSTIKILKEGDMAVVDPGVAHCVNSILGEYEHIVAQVPSAFQYGFGFKMGVDVPDDYDEQRLQQEAFNEFDKLQQEKSASAEEV